MKKFFRYTAAVIRALFYCAAAAFIIGYLYGIRFFIVTTGSMAPAIPVGSICIVDKNSPFRDIREGDIISFRIGEDMLVTHRAVSIDSDGITTKGDANNSEDIAKVTESNYIGKTVWSMPKLGQAVTFLKSGSGLIIVITLFILLTMISLSSRANEKHHPE